MTQLLRDSIVEQIAKKKMFIDTLETRNSDSLDFHDLSVATIKEALEAAYEAGKNASKIKVDI